MKRPLADTSNPSANQGLASSACAPELLTETLVVSVASGGDEHFAMTAPPMPSIPMPSTQGLERPSIRFHLQEPTPTLTLTLTLDEDPSDPKTQPVAATLCHAAWRFP